jgi:hypothetical protein
MQEKMVDKAIPFFQKAVEYDPKCADAYVNLAGAHIQLKKPTEAIAEARKALEIAPQHHGAMLNLGSALDINLQLDEGKVWIEKAISLNPPYAADCWMALSMAAQYEGDVHQAICGYAQALDLEPNNDLARFSLGMMQMLDGQWDKGLVNYEARVSHVKPYPTDKIQKFAHGPGDTLSGKRVLICAEQGAGDNIMVARYFSVLRTMHPTTEFTFLCADTMAGWMGQYDGPRFNVISPAMNANGTWDVQIPMLSIPLYLHDRRVPFLIPPERPIGLPAYEGGHGVGFCWQGSRSPNHDQFRSMKFHLMCEKLVHVAKDAGHRTVCLQSDAEGWQKTAFDAAPPFPTWHDTALAINGLDLVVTVDTAVAHLAGTLGVPTLLLLPLITDWRWGMRVPTTPFYPSMRIMRQTKLGDWNPVIEEAKEALCSTSLSL